MKLTKAIEIIGSNGLCDAGVTWGDYLEAVMLGGEALKFRQRWEQQEGEDDFPLLPGETKE